MLPEYVGFCWLPPWKSSFANMLLLKLAQMGCHQITSA